MPYTKILKEFRTKAEKDLGNLKTYLNYHLTGEKAPKKSQNRVYLLEDSTQNAEILSSISSSGAGRSLAATCYNSGIATTASVTIYTCNGETVKEDDYDSGDSACSSSTSTVDVCYCPFDYYGDQCETHNGMTCEIERENYPPQCSGVDSFDYVYSYSGIPPCYYVDSGDTITMRNKLVCRTVNSDYDFEGVKPSKYVVNTQPSVGTNPFAYDIDSDTFKQTNAPSATQRLTFINWARMNNPYTLDHSLTADNLAGIDTYNQDITFSSSLVSYAFVGRYNYELIVIDSSSGANYTSGYFGGYFEQKGYVEPGGSHKISKALVIILPILGVLLVIAFFMGWKMYQRNKRRELVERVEVDPLLADQ
jgi:hypothetical protein